jgi:hypothetical protein
VNLKQLVSTAFAVSTIAVAALGPSSVLAQDCAAAPCQPTLMPVDQPTFMSIDQTPSTNGYGRADLVIRDWRVYPDLVAGDARNQVKEDQAYRLCYDVGNIGMAAAGPFVVAGGGLGIPFTPTRAHAGLAAGATTTGCLSYPTTPAPGVYFLSVEADHTHIVAELNEGNNSRTEAIIVMP